MQLKYMTRQDLSNYINNLLHKNLKYKNWNDEIFNFNRSYTITYDSFGNRILELHGILYKNKDLIDNSSIYIYDTEDWQIVEESIKDYCDEIINEDLEQTIHNYIKNNLKIESTSGGTIEFKLKDDVLFRIIN